MDNHQNRMLIEIVAIAIASGHSCVAPDQKCLVAIVHNTPTAIYNKINSIIMLLSIGKSHDSSI